MVSIYGYNNGKCVSIAMNLFILRSYNDIYLINDILMVPCMAFVDHKSLNISKPSLQNGTCVPISTLHDD